MAIEVFAADEQADHPVDTLRWVRLAEAILQEEGVRGEAELSMLFVDEQAMTDLNKRFLGKDGPTDVLAFPIDDEPIEGGRSPDSGGTGPGFTSEPSDLPTVLGDVVICPAVAFRNAPEHAGTYDDELALLLVHGVLHLLGMDHDDDEEAELMEQRERLLLAKLYRPSTGPDRAGGANPAGAVGAAGTAGATGTDAADDADGPDGAPGTPGQVDAAPELPTIGPRSLGPRTGRTAGRRPPGPLGEGPSGAEPT